MNGFGQSLILSGQAPLPVAVEANAFVPALYENAIKGLIACQTLDEARTFDSAAQALAAWAKIYADDRAAHAARVLKLHAYRRIGVLAEQQRPKSTTQYGAKGPGSLLREHGFKNNQAIAALKVARMPQEAFDRETAKPRPSSPAMLAQINLRKNPAWAKVSARFAGLVSILRKTDVASLIASLDDTDLACAERNAAEAQRWLISFQQHVAQRRRAAA